MQTETHRDRQRHTETDRDSQKKKHTETDGDTQRHTHRQRRTCMSSSELRHERHECHIEGPATVV